MNIIISGGSGFIGSHLIPKLIEAGHSVAVWSRTPKDEKRPGVRAFPWSPAEGLPPSESLEGVDAVIHLAGESVAHKWSDEVKKKIVSSRVLGTQHLVEAISRSASKPKVLVSSSATGYYGDRADEELTEASSQGVGFLADVCRDWEREADLAHGLGVRVVKIRTGMVLGPGGALAKLVPAFRTKMGGKLGSGKQWMPWVHLDDLGRLYQFAAENPVAGVLNGTAPNPVRNETFTEALGEALDQPSKITVPEFALKMMFGEMSEMMLGSQKVFPVATEKTGFTYGFSEVLPALRDAVKGIQ